MNEIPARESRRVRTQPLTVTDASPGAWPARMPRTLNSLCSIGRELLRRAALSSDSPAASTRVQARRSFFRFVTWLTQRHGMRPLHSTPRTNKSGLETCHAVTYARDSCAEWRAD